MVPQHVDVPPVGVGLCLALVDGRHLFVKEDPLHLHLGTAVLHLPPNSLPSALSPGLHGDRRGHLLPVIIRLVVAELERLL